MFCIIVHFKSLEEVAVYNYMAQLGLQMTFIFSIKRSESIVNVLLLREELTGRLKHKNRIKPIMPFMCNQNLRMFRAPYDVCTLYIKLKLIILKN